MAASCQWMIASLTGALSDLVLVMHANTTHLVSMQMGAMMECRVWAGFTLCYMCAYLFLTVLAGTRLRRLPYNRFRTGNLLFKWQVGTIPCPASCQRDVPVAQRGDADMCHALLRCRSGRGCG